MPRAQTSTARRVTMTLGPRSGLPDAESRLPAVIDLGDEHGLAVGGQEGQDDARGAASTRGHDLERRAGATASGLPYDQPLDLEFTDAPAFA